MNPLVEVGCIGFKSIRNSMTSKKKQIEKFSSMSDRTGVPTKNLNFKMLIFNVPMAAKLPRFFKTWHLHQEVGQVAVGYGETTWKNQGENSIAFYCYCHYLR